MVLTSSASVTEEEIRKAGQPFERGRYKRSLESEVVARKLQQKLYEFVGWFKREHYSHVARLMKEVTKERTTAEALDFLESSGGSEWRKLPVAGTERLLTRVSVKKYLIRTGRASDRRPPARETVLNPTRHLDPIPVYPENPVNGPLNVPAEFNHTMIEPDIGYHDPRARYLQAHDLSTAVFVLRWLSLLVPVVLVVWLISILPQMAVGFS